MTHTFVTLEIDRNAFEEIWRKLLIAGYRHQLQYNDNGRDIIDMKGIALVSKTSPQNDPGKFSQV